MEGKREENSGQGGEGNRFGGVKRGSALVCIPDWGDKMKGGELVVAERCAKMRNRIHRRGRKFE